jgi:hypothetical protein
MHGPAGKAAFPKEFAGSQQRNHGLFALPGNHLQFDRTFSYEIYGGARFPLPGNDLIAREVHGGQFPPGRQKCGQDHAGVAGLCGVLPLRAGSRFGPVRYAFGTPPDFTCSDISS